MDTHRLRYFLQIADEGSMTRAASVLGIAQPALSRQIKLLEEDLGVTLFRRTARGVQLTEEGERLRASTAAPLRQLELAMRYVGTPLARLERGLHLGLPPTVAAVLAAPLLGSLKAAFPRVDFHVRVAPTDQLVAEMLKGAVDFSVIDPVPDGRIFAEDLVSEDLVLVGGPESGLNPAEPIPFAELASYPLVLPDSPIGIRTHVTNTALQKQVTIVSRFATDSLELMREHIVAGHGYGVLPLSSCARQLESGRLRHAPLCDPVLVQQWRLGVTSQLDLPTGFSTRVAALIREETVRLVASSAWIARVAEKR